MLQIVAALGFGLGLFLAPPAGVTRETLPNGLDVLIEDRPGTETVAVRVYVRTGSLNEEPFLGAGISHLYEHLLAGGTTTTRGEKETAEILRSIGGVMNAYTSYDLTCYHVTTTGEHAATAIDLLADWMRNNTLDPREVARETEVVQRELEKDEDEPANVLWRLHMETAYRRSLIRLPVIGYKSNIRRITRDDLVRFYKERYAPNNAVLVIVGDVRGGPLLERARAAFGPWERRTLRAGVLPSEPPQTAPRRAEREMPVSVASVKIGWPSVDLLSPDLYALDVLAFVLGQGESALLKQQLVDEKKLATAVATSSWTPSFGAGQFMIDLEVPEAGKVEEAIEAAMKAARALEGRVAHRAEGMAERLARAKKQKIAEHVFAIEKNEGRAESVAQDWIGTGDPWFSERYVERVQSVSVDDLGRVARQYLDPEKVTVTVVRPAGTGSGTGSGTGTGTRQEAQGTGTETGAGTRKVVLETGLVVVMRPMAAAKGVAMQASFAG
ncbi:insulinase family protein, partial [bacterium]|nr:insulinase family protein [bacterium]